MLMFINIYNIIKNYVLILDLEDTVADQDNRLTEAEENIQGPSLFLIPIQRNYQIYLLCFL